MPSNLPRLFVPGARAGCPCRRRCLRNDADWTVRCSRCRAVPALRVCRNIDCKCRRGAVVRPKGIMRFILRALLTCSALVLAIGCEDDDDDNNDNGNVDNEPDEGDLTDGQIADVMRTANFGEIAQADAARPRLTSVLARDYADDMREEHTASNLELDQLVTQLALDFEESDVSQELQDGSDRIVALLQGASLQDIDQLYLQSQIDGHDNLLEVIEDELLPEVLDAELQTFLEDTRDAVESHRDEADTALEDFLEINR